MATYEAAMQKRSDDMSARSVAAQRIAAAFVRVRDQHSPFGWVLFEEAHTHTADSFVVGFSMRFTGYSGGQCVFQVGPDRQVLVDQVVTGMDATLTKTSLNDLGDDGFEKVLGDWAMSVRRAASPARDL